MKTKTPRILRITQIDFCENPWNPWRSIAALAFPLAGEVAFLGSGDESRLVYPHFNLSELPVILAVGGVIADAVLAREFLSDLFEGSGKILLSVKKHSSAIFSQFGEVFASMNSIIG